jgi:membrane dipeptidase
MHIYINKNNIPYLKEYYKNIYTKKNVSGAIFNLYFMSEKEMNDELNIEKEEIDVIKMLETVDKIIKEENIINPKTKYLYGIEGLDYLKNIEDIDILYNIGLRSTNIVWNNETKFGGGTKASSKIGLTSLGKELVHKLIEKNIAIDLSHANEKTFYDIAYECENCVKKGKKPIVFASHSNAKSICNVPRNLSDEQMLKIKELGGIIGIVSYKKFCAEETENIDFAKEYLKHIKHVENLLGGLDNIALSTDDMNFASSELENANIYNLKTVGAEVRKLLSTCYSKDDIEKIMHENIEAYLFPLFT